MPDHEDRWIVTADGRRARFLRCKRTTHGKWHIEEAAAGLVNTWEHSHERHRPAMLGRGSRSGPPHEAAFGHEEEEEQRRFAGEVTRWLDARVKEIGSLPLIVFCAPRFLGILKGKLANGMEGRVRIVELELTRLRPHELAEHSEVVGALESA